MKIVSGGQTGVDQAALDAAIALEIPHGGWCPKGRRAELDKTIPEKYNLKETDSDQFEVRTKLNIKDSDGTLIIVPKLPIEITDGTILTLQEVKQKNKPHLIIDQCNPIDRENILKWVNNNHIKVLNVAGPRESQSPGIYKKSFVLLKNVFSILLKNTLQKNQEISNTKRTLKPF